MIVLLSGVSGSGKTSTCKLVAKTAHASQIPTGGILCGALFHNGKKIGIECSDVAANPAQPPNMLARIRPDWTSALSTSPTSKSTGNPVFDDSDPEILRYGMWEFSKQVLTAADETISGYKTRLAGYANRRPPLIFVDEIGPLELDRGTGLVKTLAMLDEAASQYEAGTRFLVLARPDIATRLKDRWSQSTIVEMSHTEYHEIAAGILATLALTARNTG